MRYSVLGRAAVALSLVLSASLVAQQPAAKSVANNASSGDPFVRYSTPGQCKQAAARLQQLYWRDKRPDTVVYAPLTDSVPASVIAAARLCASRFSVESTPPRELANLGELYLWAAQDNLALAAIDRLRTSMRQVPPADRAWSMYRVLNSMLYGRPPRMSQIRALLRELDSLGAPAGLYRMLGHTQLSQFATTIDDRTTALSEARAALAASAQMSRDDRIDFVYSILNVYEALSVPVALTKGGPAAIALFDTAETDLRSLRPAASRDWLDLDRSIRSEPNLYTLLGTSGLQSVQGSAWFGAKGDTVRPRPGRVSLLVFTSGGCGGGCYQTHAVVRRLNEKYGAKGLDIVLMTRTEGWFRDLPMPSPAVEADSIGSYFLNYLKLPVTLAVETTRFNYIEDGRRRNEQTANAKTYDRGRQGVLIDRRGVVRWLDSMESENEPLWNALIQAAIEEAGPTR